MSILAVPLRSQPGTEFAGYLRIRGKYIQQKALVADLYPIAAVDRCESLLGKRDLAIRHVRIFLIHAQKCHRGVRLLGRARVRRRRLDLGEVHRAAGVAGQRLDHHAATPPGGHGAVSRRVQIKLDDTGRLADLGMVHERLQPGDEDRRREEHDGYHDQELDERHAARFGVRRLAFAFHDGKNAERMPA